jgi:sortase A
MRVAIPRNSVKSLTRWSRNVLLTAGAGLLGYCGFVLAETWMYQRQESQLFDRARLQVAAIPTPGTDSTNGLLDERTLQRAGGHIAGTAFPGQRGNVGIAGHRDTLFRPLRNIQQNDVITLTTLAGEYRYRVVSTEIVSPSDVTVLQPNGHEVLTLVTCYPFYFVGPAPDRFIVRAERVMGST